MRVAYMYRYKVNINTLLWALKLTIPSCIHEQYNTQMKLSYYHNNI